MESALTTSRKTSPGTAQHSGASKIFRAVYALGVGDRAAQLRVRRPAFNHSSFMTRPRVDNGPGDGYVGTVFSLPDHKTTPTF